MRRKPVFVRPLKGNPLPLDTDTNDEEAGTYFSDARKSTFDGEGARLTSTDRGGKNFAPQARADSAATNEDTPATVNVLSNDGDRNGDPLAVSHIGGQAVSAGQTVALASGARVTLNADGTLRYDLNGALEALNTGQSAADSFKYTIADGRGGTASATVSMTIAGITDGTALNTTPDAVNDTASTNEDTVKTGSVLANDRDADGDPLSVTAVNGSGTAVGQSLTLASGAKLTLKADGTFSYTPNGAFEALNTGQSATDSFTYTASDGRGGSDTATVTMTIAGVTDASTSGSETSGAVATSTAPAYAIDDVTYGGSSRWNYPGALGTADTVTFAFAQSTPSYYSTSISDQAWTYNNFRPFSAQQMEMTRAALAQIEDLCNLDFVEVGTIAEAAISFGIANIFSGYVGYAWRPSGSGINSRYGDVWIDDGWAGSTFTPGTSPYKTLIHEIGHAIGLSHPSAMTGVENSRMYTVMSYSAHPTMSGDAQTYMLYDVAGIQHMYGTDTATRAGNDTYTLAHLNNKIMTLWDGGGIDTLDLSAASQAVRLDLKDGAYSTVATSGSKNLAIAYGVVIENALGGAGADTLIGNATGNRLSGGRGNDSLTGAAGGDIFDFDAGWGSDTVTDFARGADKLDLAGTGYAYSQLTINTSSTGTTVTDGLGNTIVLAGVASLDPGDFLFGGVG